VARITQIQVRRDTAASWTTAQTVAGATPILAQGEIGFETDTGKFKIGDGTTLWGALTYATDGAKLTGTIAATTATTATTTTGNAGTATALQTARNINGVAFDGSANITVTATPTAGSVTDASISSTLSASKITDVASTVVLQRAKFYQGATTLDIPARQFVASTSAPIINGTITGHLFTPEKDYTVTKISNYVKTVGVYSTVNTGNPVVVGVSGASTIQFTSGTWVPTFTPVVGMTVSGSGVGVGAKITAYNSGTFTITVDVPNSGTVSTLSGAITLTTTAAQAKSALFTVGSSSQFTPIAGAISGWQSNPYTTTQLYDFNISSTVLTAGVMYAVGMVSTWTGAPVTTPQLAFQSLAGQGFAALSPQMTFTVAGTDISGLITAATGNLTLYYSRLA